MKVAVESYKTPAVAKHYIVSIARGPGPDDGDDAVVRREHGIQRRRRQVQAGVEVWESRIAGFEGEVARTETLADHGGGLRPDKPKGLGMAPADGNRAGVDRLLPQQHLCPDLLDGASDNLRLLGIESSADPLRKAGRLLFGAADLVSRLRDLGRQSHPRLLLCPLQVGQSDEVAPEGVLPPRFFGTRGGGCGPLLGQPHLIRTQPALVRFNA